MTREESYRILQLKPGASEAEIRRQFKRMALKVHPDINPSPRANEEFILLTEAMETLLRPEPVAADRSAQRQAKRQETDTEKKARMDEARKRYEYQKARKIHENNRYYKSLTTGLRWLIFKWIIRLSWILALALILDTVLPTHFEKDELIAFSESHHNGILYDKITYAQLRNSGSYFLEHQSGYWNTSYPEILVEKSWLLHTPIAIYTNDDYHFYRSGVDFHLGAIRWVIVVLLLFPLMTYLRRRKDITFVFLYQLSFWGIGGLVIFLLLTQNRLVHLLSLGFL